MTTRLLSFIFIFLLSILFLPQPAFAIVDPLSIPNNKFGIHILFDNELQDAANLINTNGGDWGYVTIPIQSGDRDLEKWQKFMNEAKRLHIIPIIRLATHGDYFNKDSWRKPNEEDILDFANFLNSLDWPIENRYIIVFNEVNRGDEWGGEANPGEYALLLDYAVTAFKSLNSNFFIISSGMDNAAANGNNAVNQYTYMREMNDASPGVFERIDGLASHSYPNPAFSQPPTVHTPMSITSFKFEQSLAEELNGKKLPIFITETGWVNTGIPEEKLADYYKSAYSNVWSDPSVVAVTPFLLRAGTGAFKPFSFLREDGNKTKQYDAIKDLSKVKGQPHIALPDHNAQLKAAPVGTVPEVNFAHEHPKVQKVFHLTSALTTAFQWMFKL